VGPRAGLDDVKRKFLTLPGLELQPLGRPTRSQSLYRLSYPGERRIIKIGGLPCTYTHTHTHTHTHVSGHPTSSSRTSVN
jgi:hypothetical protein